MIEKNFIKRGINKAKLEAFLDRELGLANYSHVDIIKTPVSTNIIIYAQKPGMVIGRGGSRIKEIINNLREEFKIENPQVEAEEVKEPDLDARITAKNIAGWIEKGGHPKRVGNTYLGRVMKAGAVGVQIEISGKLRGERGRTDKLMAGYIKKCGKTADIYVDKAYVMAVTKPGAVGIKVMIMRHISDDMHTALALEKIKTEKTAEVEKKEEGKEKSESETQTKSESETQTKKTEPQPKMGDEELLKKNVREIKKYLDDSYDIPKLIDMEKKEKNRKTILKLLENYHGTNKKK